MEIIFENFRNPTNKIKYLKYLSSPNLKDKISYLKGLIIFESFQLCGIYQTNLHICDFVVACNEGNQFN